MKYKLLPDITDYNGTYESHFICRTTDNTYIPKNEANRDYQEYLEWVAAGNTPEPADE